ncbi:hypothetical protein BS47DRAFT_1392182 [Hydnum rufescens UP504]|uniref:Mitochondrial distribution and morphology protein 34 n=1 Tax=Hydnum rufescens UP504 TaxID=1448309 RepID=A0A9P6DXM6_9AGAM|nr:hypothetical protein BS47DRAFT_1392182 [Hydnum rufescens UP504]
MADPQRCCYSTIQKGEAAFNPALAVRGKLKVFGLGKGFSFKWPRFSDKFHADTMQMLDAALNKGNKPPIIEDRIEVVELEMGTQVRFMPLPLSHHLNFRPSMLSAPELEVRDIGDLTMDQFRGIFKLSYSGDAYIVLRTKANPLYHKKPGMDLLGGSRGILAANQSLVVPMLLRLSNFKLNAYVVLVVSKQKGITLVFKTDPLQNVDVSSTFDSIAVIQKYIQREIEGQLRDMFREDLPSIIHRLSQRWIPGNTKIETPYLQSRVHVPSKGERHLETMSAPGHDDHHKPYPFRFPPLGIRPNYIHRPASTAFMGTSQSLHLPQSNINRTSPKRSSTRSVQSFSTSLPLVKEDSQSSFPEIEDYDPTYGMRPEGLPAKSTYGGFARLWTPSRGLGDLTEDPAEGNVDDIDITEQSFDMLDWDESRYEDSAPGSAMDMDEEPQLFETIPAVGGGTITRPRVYHSQSLIQHPSVNSNPNPVKTPSLVQGTTRRTLPYNRSSGHLSIPIGRGSLPQRIVPGEDQMDLGASARTYDPHRANSSLPGPSRPGRSMASHTPPSWGQGPFRNYVMPSLYPNPNLNYLAPQLEGIDTQEGLHQSPESSFISRSSSGAITHSLSTPPSSELPPADMEDALGKGATSLSPMHSYDDPFYDPTLHINQGLDDSPNHHPLRPGLNNTAQLSTLSHSNRTLSPFTRSVEHFTVRSVPHNRNREQPDGGPTALEKQPAKAKRKRTFRIGGSKTVTNVEPPTNQSVPGLSPPLSPDVPSELSEVDHYFTESHHSRRRPSFRL